MSEVCTFDLELRGQAAYVTGGANGLGEAIAETLLAHGVRLVISDVDRERLSSKQKEWSAAGRAAVTMSADLSTRDGAEIAAAKVLDVFHGPPDILINNVGCGFTRPFADTTDEEWLEVFNLNFFSHVRTSRVLLPAIAERRRGVVLFVSSDLAKQPEANTATYSATKAAVLSLTKTLSLEYAPLGVRVNAICPGPIWTQLWTRPGGVVDELMSLYGVGREEAVRRFVGDRKIPLGIGEPSDVANLALYLVSGRAKHLTGGVYDVNGGSVRSLF